MAILGFECIIENGQVRLPDASALPEQTEVYVILPDLQRERPARIWSPRLAHREQVADFVHQIVEVQADAET
jgi:hypothetical protein